MLKIQVSPDRVYDLVNTGNATMFETLKISDTGYTLSQWDKGYAKLTQIVVNPDAEVTVEDLFNDGDFLISIAISVWIARLRKGEVLTFDENLKDWSFSDFRLIVPEVSEFLNKAGVDTNPKKPVRTSTPKDSVPAKKPRKKIV